MHIGLIAQLAVAVGVARALLNATETSTSINLVNDRVTASIVKPGGRITVLKLDGVDILGPRSGNVGSMYLDCYCTSAGAWTPGTSSPTFKLFTGTDSAGVKYGGASMSDKYSSSGLSLEQYFFLREGETGLHMFSRVVYNNSAAPTNARGLQELRTLFRPNTAIWTHLLTKEKKWASLPSADAVSKQVEVQDATWYLGNTPNDPYVKQEADWFTKYTFQDTWRDLKAFGLFADGTKTSGNATFGAWTVMNTRDTYFGGPLHSDLTVDGIVYDYISSNHHGDQTPNITHGFDRTFGPRYFHLNRGAAGTDILTLYRDAAQYADPTWNTAFYDSIAKHVPGYTASSGRGTFKLQVTLPSTAKRPIAVLAQNGIDFQDNVFDTKAYQYWADINSSGQATIPQVKAGTYRLTIYADGLFGQYIQDGVTVSASGTTTTTVSTWTEESAGTELWRIGLPDKSSGEYRHGYAVDETKTRKPEQYRVYWAHYDFINDFPNGVRFRVGTDDSATALNYVHWSVFGGKGNSIRPQMVVGTGNINNWTLVFDAAAASLQGKTEATFTVQLAGAKTAAGNTDVYNATEPHSNLKYTVNVNGKDLDPWVIPYYQSSSCAVRSAVTCYNLARKFKFATGLLKTGENTIVLSLPFGGKNAETAVLTEALYVQYDALRLEVK